MKSNQKTKTTILLILGIIFALSPIFINNLRFTARNRDISSSYNDEFEYDNLKISALSAPIYIDDNDPSSNWSVALDIGICTGNGTYSEPYVIEDLIINGEGSGTGIHIMNSNVYFRIENCTIYNFLHGIQLGYVSNGTLSNNNCSFIDGYGILVRNSNNNSIIENIASYNSWGIGLVFCDENIISENNVSHNGEGISLVGNNNEISNNICIENIEGIYLSSCYNNTVSYNAVINNSNGLRILGHYNNISENKLNNNGRYGLNIESHPDMNMKNSSYNLISGNNISDSRYGILLSGRNNSLSQNLMDKCGLILYDSSGEYDNNYLLEDIVSHSIDTSNLVNGNPIYYYKNEINLNPVNYSDAGQLILINCKNSLIENLNISNGSSGISLYHCSKITIKTNNIFNHRDWGLALYYCNNSIIVDNSLVDNDVTGIILENCNFSKISDNTVFNNQNGISLYGIGNNVSSNRVNQNEYTGISCRGEYNLLFNNSLNSSIYGVTVSGKNHTLKKNLMKECGIRTSYLNPLSEITSHTIDTTNLVNGKPLYYYVNETGLGVSDFINAGQIILINCNNSQVVNLDLSNGSLGITLYYCFHNTLMNNNVSYNNFYGIFMIESGDCTITGNFMNNCETGIYLSYSNDNKIFGNNLNNNIRKHGSHLKEGSGIYVISSHRNQVLDNNINNNNFGLNFEGDCSNNIISGNNINNNSYSGIKIRGGVGGVGNEISKNTIMYNSEDLFLGFQSNAVDLQHYNSGTIEQNIITHNYYNGIHMYKCYYNLITNNTIEDNGATGLVIGYETYGWGLENVIYYNIFSNNGLNAEDNGVDNTWDNGLIGNYWDNYTGTDSDGDGIGDTPYYIPGVAGNQDNYPLMERPTVPQQIPTVIPGYDLVVLSCIAFFTLTMIFLVKIRKKS